MTLKDIKKLFGYVDKKLTISIECVSSISIYDKYYNTWEDFLEDETINQLEVCQHEPVDIHKDIMVIWFNSIE